MKRHVTHPEIDQDSAPFWRSLREHRAAIQSCPECGKFRFPPSPRCYYCGAPGGNWVPISGRGRIYSWIVVRHPVDKRLAGETPFIVVLVELEEGPRMSGRCVSCTPEQLKAGLPVRLGYDDINSELTLVTFTPLI